jgi:hypothetical protein
MRTVEEKAKAYDDALELAKEILKTRCITGTNGAFYRKDIEDMFPELAESEDEKIRKEIIDHVRGIRNVTESGAERSMKWLAWLEKQGEQKPVERKHIGMDLDEDKMTPFQKEVFNIVDLSQEEEKGLSNICDKLLSLAAQELEQKPAKTPQWMIDFLNKFRSNFGHAVDHDERRDIESRLLCIKQWIEGHPNIEQKPVEWSEEDEKKRNTLIGYIVSKNELGLEYADWLKSIRPQSHWKPSEEHLDALMSAIQNLYACKEKNLLLDIYEQLKG